MSGLAHLLEAEGIATVLIGLIPQHVLAMRPPRALLVPFPLGRPLGRPHDAALQLGVLAAAIGLLDLSLAVPITESFAFDGAHDAAAQDAAGQEELEGWSCPVTLAAPAPSDALAASVLGEVRALLPWFERGRQRRGHTATATSGLSPLEVPEWLASWLPGSAPDGADAADGTRLKLAVEDLKAFHLEAASAGPGDASADALNHWFWHETFAGALLLALREALAEHPDATVRTHARFTIVPAHVVQALSAGRERTP